MSGSNFCRFPFHSYTLPQTSQPATTKILNLFCLTFFRLFARLFIIFCYISARSFYIPIWVSACGLLVFRCAQRSAWSHPRWVVTSFTLRFLAFNISEIELNFLIEKSFTSWRSCQIWLNGNICNIYSA